MDEVDMPGSKVLPFARRAVAGLKRPPRFEGFPKFAREFGRELAATVAPAPLVARLMQDTKRLPD
jgi:hypothetical protein